MKELKFYEVETLMAFPGGSDGKESACNAGGLGLIPGWEDPLEKEMATTPVFLLRNSHGQRSMAGYTPWAHKRIRHDLVIKH